MSRLTLAAGWLIFWLLMIAIAVQDYVRDDGLHLWEPVLWEGSAGLVDIQWLEAADNYVVIHTATESPMMRQTLASLIAHLGPAFVRTHRSMAVHLPWIETINTLPKGDSELLLRGGARVACRRSPIWKWWRS